MSVWKALLVACLLHVTSAQDANCNYQQEVDPGQTYYVYSPNYPNYYPRGVQCRWMAYCPVGFRCKLDCSEIDIPYTNGCTQDRLMVSRGGDPQLVSAERYCGRGSLSVTSTGYNLAIGLVAASNSAGGRFMCTLTAQSIPSAPGSCRCGYKKSNRIVGGQETGVNEFPMMVGLVDTGYQQIRCGAVIVTPRSVVTAAHCLNVLTPSNTIVLVGEHNVSSADSSATRGYTVLNFVRHPRYSSATNEYDIGIVNTQQFIQFSDLVGAVCLPIKFANADFSGAYVTALGWGTTFFGGPLSDVLLKVNLQVMSQNACRATNPAYLSDKQLCTYTPGKDTCQQDSGGPHLYTDPSSGRLYSVAITSVGRFCATNNPGINTRITPFIGWIANNSLAYTHCDI